mmetsp:Transcript_130623/g.377820  ORF Transcript_130623/g.377820 Transcript_130623/m.377820 type:complete len:409 (-) Transcript_130623:6-1232(-)
MLEGIEGIDQAVKIGCAGSRWPIRCACQPIFCAVDALEARHLLHHDLSLAMHLHAANIAKARILQKVQEPRVAQHRLAELKIEARAEQPFHVGERDRAWHAVDRCTAQNLPEANAGLLPTREAHILIDPLRGHGLLPSGALLLDTMHRAAERHHVAIQVPQDPPLRHGNLHDVADLTQRSTLKEWQRAGDQHLRASVAATGERHVRIRQVLEVLGDLRPQLFGVAVDGAADINEVSWSADEKRGVLFAILGLHHKAAAGLADAAQGPRVDERHGVDIFNGARITCLARCGCRGHRTSLADALQEDAPERLQSVHIEALDRCEHIRRCWLQVPGLALLDGLPRSLSMLLDISVAGDTGAATPVSNGRSRTVEDAGWRQPAIHHRRRHPVFSQGCGVGVPSTQSSAARLQ